MKVVEGKKIYSISEVNYFAKQTLEEMTFWVEGEISSFRKNPNWNFYYLDLKDESAVLPCIAEEFMIANLKGKVTGQRILAFGNLSLYEPFGKYQFRISMVEASGEGLLQKQLDELIKKLKNEGLFDEKHKKEIPKYPKKVCVVTSVGSDAYNDFVKHTAYKFPIIELYTADVRVQGIGAVSSLLKVLPRVDKMGFDAIVITRGGGSIEDLAAFNDESVARLIFSLKTPTVVAIGHEANESLSEWVADVRASTPTDAANIITFGYQSLVESLDQLGLRLKSNSAYYFSANFQRLDHIFFKLTQTKNTFKDLPHIINSLKESLRRHEKLLVSASQIKLDELTVLLRKNFFLLTENKRQLLKNLNKSLVLLSPQNTLFRGYSITTDKSGRIIKSIKSVVVGDLIGVKLANGSLRSKVVDKQ
ncbi:MAG TPA: exodeoxyribonuclease VII large subunit [Patescibacteria group bacterium]|nr:exodeoxyribonuclease VII large subunit [Patescibacteria group bacterium]